MSDQENLIEAKSDSEFSYIDEAISSSEEESVLTDPRNIYTLSNPSPSTLDYM